MIQIRIANLTKLEEIRNDPELPEDEIKIASVQLKREIQHLIKETHQRNREKVAAIDVAEGECIGKTWSNRFKETKPRDTIKCLKIPGSGETTRDSRGMAKIAGNYHKEIQSNDRDPRVPPDEQEINEILGPIKTRLSVKNKQKLAETISEGEVREAIRKTANNKAPGLDDIPTEIWRSLDDQFLATRHEPLEKRKFDVVQMLTTVFRDIENHGMDPLAKLNEGCMSSIYKKDPENIANYHPITLLNMD